jgi:hypothetical protein
MSGAATGGIVVIVAVIALVISMMVAARRRRLQQQFGPEYDWDIADKQSRLTADAEPASREPRVQQPDIRPLTPPARASYAAQWDDLQRHFADQPQQAVAGAQRLVAVVMNERGYPTEAHDQIAADLPVQHAAVLDRYRAAKEISRYAAAGIATTDDLSQAMIHYRALFGELLVQPDPATHGR